MKYIIIVIVCFFINLGLFAQSELISNQYIYNKYSINPSFAGSREMLTANVSFSKRWTGINKSPSNIYFDISSPLKNGKIALGTQIFSKNYGVTRNTGIALTYVYKLKLNRKNKLLFGINAGLINFSNNWTDVKLTDSDDNLFIANEQNISPMVGVGASVLSRKYFIGFSVPNLLYFEPYVTQELTFDPLKINYIFTSGYYYNVNRRVKLLGSFLINSVIDEETFVDINGSAFFNNLFSVGLSYCSLNQLSVMGSCKIGAKLNLIYSYNYDLNDLASYNYGSHKVALQIYFIHRINSANPKFF